MREARREKEEIQREGAREKEEGEGIGKRKSERRRQRRREGEGGGEERNQREKRGLLKFSAHLVFCLVCQVLQRLDDTAEVS